MPCLQFNYPYLNIPVIDLHEFENSHEALEFLELELYRLYKKGERAVRLIHGIGRGILKTKVHQALKGNPLVVQFELEESGGITLVRLGKNWRV